MDGLKTGIIETFKTKIIYVIENDDLFIVVEKFGLLFASHSSTCYEDEDDIKWQGLRLYNETSLLDIHKLLDNSEPLFHVVMRVLDEEVPPRASFS